MKFDLKSMTRGIFALLLASAILASVGCGPSTPTPVAPKDKKTNIDEPINNILFGVDSDGEPLVCNGGNNRTGFPKGLQTGQRCGVCKITTDESGNRVTLCDYDLAGTTDFECLNIEEPDYFKNGSLEKEFPGICVKRIKPCTEQWQACGQPLLQQQEFDRDEYKATDRYNTISIASNEYDTDDMFCIPSIEGDLEGMGLCQNKLGTNQCEGNKYVSIPNDFSTPTTPSRPIVTDVSPNFWDMFEKKQWAQKCKEKKLGSAKACQDASEHLLELPFICIDQPCQLEPLSSTCPVGKECQVIKGTATLYDKSGKQLPTETWDSVNQCVPMTSGSKKLGERCSVNTDCEGAAGPSNVACIAGVCMEWCNFKTGDEKRECSSGRTCSPTFQDKIAQPKELASLCVGGTTNPIQTCKFNPVKGDIVQGNCPKDQLCLPLDQESQAGICIKNDTSAAASKKDLEACTSNNECALGYQCVSYTYDFTHNKELKHCMKSCPADNKDVDTQDWCDPLKKIAINRSNKPYLTGDQANQFSCLSVNNLDLPRISSGVCSMTCTKEDWAKKASFKAGSTTYICSLTPYGGLSYIPAPMPTTPPLQPGAECKDNPYGCPVGTLCMVDFDNKTAPTCRPLCVKDQVYCPKGQVCDSAKFIKAARLNKDNKIATITDPKEAAAFKEKINKIWINNQAGLCSPQ